MSRQERGILMRFADLLRPKPSPEKIVALQKILADQISDADREKYKNDRLALVANMTVATRFRDSLSIGLPDSNTGWAVAREKERLEGLPEKQLDREISQWALEEAKRLHLNLTS